MLVGNYNKGMVPSVYEYLGTEVIKGGVVDIKFVPWYKHAMWWFCK